MSELRAKIGLEVHVQLATKTKLFCGCPTQASKPNSATCPTCLGLPGAKPVLNAKAVELAVKLALALDSKIQPEMIFSRKTYFYPDMSKNYQITQFEKPLAFGGYITLPNKKKIRLRRIHIEEDPASLKHPSGITGSDYVLVDYNRSGTPLCEIVTEPDISSPAEARAFLSALLTILDYINIYDAKNFSLRADVNVSVKGGQPVEIKEITGAKEIEKALAFEIVRQESLVSMGQKIKKETRHYDADSKSTVLLREKETEEEYGYIFDSDLPVFTNNIKQIAEIKKSMPELPQQKLKRLVQQYKIIPAMAEQLVVDKELVDCFEKASKRFDSKFAAAWFAGYLRKTLTYNKLRFRDSKITSHNMLDVLKLVKENKLSDRGGEFLLRELVIKGGDALNLAKSLNLLLLSDSELEKVVKSVLNTHRSKLLVPQKAKLSKVNKQAVKDKAVKYLIGRVQQETRGRADAKKVLSLLNNYLNR